MIVLLQICRCPVTWKQSAKGGPCVSPIRTPLVMLLPDDAGMLSGSSGRFLVRLVTEEKVAVTCGADARRWRGVRQM